MKLKIDHKHSHPNYNSKYPKAEIETARKLAKKVYKELGDFVVGMSLFGSASRGAHKKHDIDILMIIDDVHIQINRELIETYRIILAKAVADVDPKRLHVQTISWSAFWEYVRAGDPVAINILRDSISLIDNGFFDVLQTLLFQGRIRPSEESIQTYASMASNSIASSNAHIRASIIDLYWASINVAHAALMRIGEIPPSPAHVADMIQKKLVDTGRAPARSATLMRHMFLLSKHVMHGHAKKLTGEDYDRYRKHVKTFLADMEKIIK
jgi:predicted nucleotidyltransferase